MAINYSVVAMKKPGQSDEPAKYYAKAQAAGVVEIDELAEEISYATSLTDGDVVNAIRALVKQVAKHIGKGEIVRLGNLGSFQAQLSSEGAEAEEKFTPASIRKVHLQFRPGNGLQGSLEMSSQLPQGEEAERPQGGRRRYRRGGWQPLITFRGK